MFFSPYLPEIRAKNVIISGKTPQKIIKKLEFYGINCHFTEKCDKMSAEVCFHPDMLIFVYGDAVYCEKNNIRPVKEIFAGKHVKNVEICEKVPGYPYEAMLNGFVCNNKLICCKRSFGLIKELEDKVDGIIYVRQGYTKCSICAVDERAFITEDEGIYRACTKEGFDVLLLKSREVRLDGYNCGFIGGASGKIDKNILAFFGNISLHSEYKTIESFAASHGVEIVSLSDDPLYDYGGILTDR